MTGLSDPAAPETAAVLSPEAEAPLASASSETIAASVERPEPAVRRVPPLADRLLAEGRYLFRHRSRFVALLLLPAAAAFEWKRTAGVATDSGVWIIAGLLLCGLGLAVRALTLGWVPSGTSARDTREPRAPSLNTEGTYSVLRHPLYLGNLLVLLGLALAVGVWWFTVIAALVFWLLFERVILVEEAFLQQQFGAPYERWASRTPAFVPKPALWRPPEAPFSWRRALGREDNTLMLIGSLLLFVRAIDRTWVASQHPLDWLRTDPIALWSYGALVAVVVVLRLARKGAAFFG